MTIAMAGHVSAQAERISFSAVRPYSPADVARGDMLVVPANISVDAKLRVLIETMLARSSTFRRQCLRIGNEHALAVHITRTPVRLTGSVRAISQISRQSGGGIVARLTLHPYDNDIEMIAHEFEHIIEQLDGVDLAARARLAQTGVTDTGRRGDMFETMRAQRMGLKVASELRPSRGNRAPRDAGQ
jgi:hypothetical protein